MFHEPILDILNYDINWKMTEFFVKSAIASYSVNHALIHKSLYYILQLVENIHMNFK